MEIALRVHVVQRITSNISGRTGPIFEIFSPYESSVCVDNGSVTFSNILRDAAMATKSFVNVRYNTAKTTGVFCQIFPDILDRFSQSFHRERALCVSMIDLKFFFNISRYVAMATKSFVNVRYNTAKKLAYFVKYFWIYWTYFHNLFTI